MNIAVTHSMDPHDTATTARNRQRYETENRLVWNEQERRDEERELVYEISWIPELNTWRRFLRAQRSK